MEFCLALDMLKGLNLVPNPHNICTSLLQHSYMAVKGWFGPITGTANIGIVDFETISTVLAVPRFLPIA
jgi:hypothetical protein